MNPEDLSRRSLLQALAVTIGAAALPFSWAEAARAWQEAQAASRLPAGARMSFLSAAEAADVEAVAAQIIPTDDSPGAREAGVVYFIDRALGDVPLAARRRLPRAAGRRSRRLVADVIPARLRSRRSRSDQQIAYLKTSISTPFFAIDAAADAARHVHHARVRRQPRRHRLEADRLRGPHVFQPPFGYYDRDYPGFVDRSGEHANERAHLSGFRDRRFRHRRLRRGGRRDRARAGAGRAHGRGAGAGTAALAGGLRARRAEGLVPRRHHQRRGQESADVPRRSRRRRRSSRRSSRRSGMGASSAAPACTTPPTSGASTRSTSSSAACSARSPAPASPTGRSPTPISSRTTPRSSGRSACRASPARARSIRRAPKPYPMPPLPVKSSGVLLERGARKLGLHPFPAPMAINSQPYRGRPACVHCGFCHGFACEVGAKASTLTTVIPEAEATGRCEVRPDSYVVADRDQQAGPRHRRRPISIAIGASASSGRARWSCAPTAPRRRGCC